MIVFPKNAITFAGATHAKIDFASAMLKNDSFSEIPAEYAKFLLATDGAIVGEAEFYGAEAHARQNYVFPDIAAANRVFKDMQHPLAKGNLMLARGIEAMLMWEASTGFFVLCDRLDFAEIARAATFEEAFGAMVNA